MKLLPASQIAGALLLTLLPISIYGRLEAMYFLAAMTIAMLAAAFRNLRSWLILLALLLTLAPGLDCILVLTLRSLGLHAYLTGSLFSPDSQINSLLFMAAVSTFIFVLGLCAGWLLLIRQRGLRSDYTPVSLSAATRWVLFALWSFCLISFYSEMGGRTILSAQYGQSTGNALIYSGMYAVIANMALLTVELSHWGRSRRIAMNALWAGECVVLLLLGNRVDVLFALLLLLLVRNRNFSSQARVAAVGVLVLIPLFTFWGFYRQIAAFDLHQGGLISYTVSTSLESLPTLGGLGPAALTTTDAIYLQQSGQFHYMYGKSYLEFFARTAPLALDPNRPASVADLFGHYDLPTLGGVTPVAEAYLNAGLWGLLPIGLMFGAVLACLENLCVRSGSGWLYATYCIMVAMSFRTWLYETFSLYKGLVVFFLFVVIVMSLHRLTSPNVRLVDKLPIVPA
ncbi:MAG TPA: hypothetical protein VN709_12215 [Terriglobales bacterium]|nr:hypothetical protein [Terriglobales bacterium]